MRKPIKTLAPWVVAIAAASSGSAFATGMFGGGGATIDACVKPANGSVRLLDVGQTCGPSEQAISWNVQGPAGPTGPRGDKGDKGDPGLVWRGAYSATQSYDVGDAVSSQGASYVATAHFAAQTCTSVCVDTNAPGLNTAWSLLADRGANGEKGDTGETGATGPQGITGPAGTAGDAFYNSGMQQELYVANDATVAHIPLDAGDYIVVAKLVAFSSAMDFVNQDRDVNCWLIPSGASFNSGDQSQLELPGFGSTGTMSLILPYHATAAKRIDLICAANGGNSTTAGDDVNVQIELIRIAAIKVASVTYAP